jgi:hypothetical protein
MAPNRQFAAPAYLVALALIVIPPFDSLMQVLPLRFGEARWRFGAFGLFSNATLLPLLGILIAFVVATVLEQYTLRRVLGVLTGLGVLLFASMWVVFALDVLQVKNAINPAAALAFKVASVTAAAKSGFAMLTMAFFTYASFRGIPRRQTVKAPAAGIVSSRGESAPLATAGAAPVRTVEAR